MSTTFHTARTLALRLPGVDAAVRYDGSTVLQAGGVFMAGLATHSSAEPGSLVVRIDLEERPWLLDDAPETYYVTGYYQKHPVVLVPPGPPFRVISPWTLGLRLRVIG